MDSTLFTDEPATLAECAERWNCHTNQLLYICRTRKVPHVKTVAGTRLFDKSQQMAIHAILRKYPMGVDASITLAPQIPQIEEEQDAEIGKIQERLAALESEVSELREVVVTLRQQVALHAKL